MPCAPEMMHQIVQILPDELRKESQLGEVDVCQMVGEPACKEPG